jgi:hypothetical protein
MRRYLLTAAALALPTTAAHAEVDLMLKSASAVTAVVSYQLKCAPLPQNFQAIAFWTMQSIPAEELKTKMLESQTFYKNAGPEKFCELTKPLVEGMYSNAVLNQVAMLALAPVDGNAPSCVIAQANLAELSGIVATRGSVRYADDYPTIAKAAASINQCAKDTGRPALPDWAIRPLDK